MDTTERIETRAGEGGGARTLAWRSAAGLAAPKRVVEADDSLSADTAFRLACEGTALLWRGDFQNARQLLQAMGRRLERKRGGARGETGGRGGGAGTGGAGGSRPRDAVAGFPQAFHLYRQEQARRARTLNMLLVPVEAGHRVALRRAPDVRQACELVHGPCTEAYATPLRELLGLVGAWQWREKGVTVPALGGRIHAHFGVFPPTRDEYLDLVAKAPLPLASAGAVRDAAALVAFDIGTGSGVIAALLARRGVGRVVATDTEARAVACALENVERLGMADRVTVLQGDLYPAAQADLVVCNPPWLPSRPATSLESAVYDPDSRMLRGFLDGLAAHLRPGGEGWLVISDLAVHLGLRQSGDLEQWIAAAGLAVAGRLDTRPRHAKAADRDDPLHAARTRELTTLWRLRVAC